ncbi:LysR family transcriptional regulator [Metabacillus arenae]|uniref:LysR family transcriptional regulator n=1 Tax=Metabacillus arenae TaxID=2771434 RepID=A0A926NGE3_9BACI|nr:LysR family transcriptional regulator [Metabacillus arenae]MBD1382964.1 LysR family transcriptional regulator [Metabacillus arenae]
MDLRHLKYFVTVADELHFGRAAKKLRIAQPPLSQQIKSLESELGVLLLHRTKRQVTLTEAGEVFYKRATKILKEVSQAKEEVRRIHNGEIGQLIIGFAGLVTFDLLPLVLRSFQAAFPNVEIVLHHLTTTEQITLLHQHDIDVGILIPPIDNNDIELKIIKEEPFVVALRKDHPHEFTSPIDISKLASENFIMPPRSAGLGYYDSIISLCHQAGFSPFTTQEAKELQTVVSLVASGIGVAILPSSIQYLKNDSVSYVSIQNCPNSIKTAIAYHKDNKSPVLGSFLNLVNGIFEETHKEM